MIHNVNSKKRVSGVYNNFTTSPLPYLSRQIKSVKLLDVQIPMSMNTFNPTNNVIIFTEATSPATTRQATITAGNYNEDTILVALKAALDAAGTQPYTCTYNASTNSITITAPAIFTLYFANVLSTAYDRLGFLKVNTTPSTSVTSSCIQLSPSGTYFLSIGGLGIWPVFLDASSFEYATWQNDLFDPFPVTNLAHSLQVRLSDTDGNECILNRDWTFNLGFL